MEQPNEDMPLFCTLTSQELQQRKQGMLSMLKAKVLERKELPNGYAFTFDGDDETLDMLVEVVKAERQCCRFFTFRLSIEASSVILEITGPEGARSFIIQEMDL